MKVNWEFWKKHICSRIREVGKQVWKNGFNDTVREKEYVKMKECPRNESFADGNVGAGVRLMVRGGCLPVRGSARIYFLHTGACLFNNDIRYLLKFTVIEFKSTEVSFR